METRNRSYWVHTVSRPVVMTALKVAAVVGTILALINHGPSFVQGQLGMQQWIQIALTYLVPYLVSTYSSVKMLLLEPTDPADSHDKSMR